MTASAHHNRKLFNSNCNDCPSQGPNRTQKFCRKSAISLIFFFFWQNARKLQSKKRIPLPGRTPQNPWERRGKTLKKSKAFLAEKQRKEFQKKRKRRARFKLAWNLQNQIAIASHGNPHLQIPKFLCRRVRQKSQRFPGGSGSSQSISPHLDNNVRGPWKDSVHWGWGWVSGSQDIRASLTHTHTRAFGTLREAKDTSVKTSWNRLRSSTNSFGPPPPPEMQQWKNFIWCTVENVEDFLWNFLRPFSLEVEGRKPWRR